MIKLLLAFLMLITYSNTFAQSPMQECWYVSKKTAEELNEKQCFSLNESADYVLGDAQMNPKVAAQLNFDGQGLNFVRGQHGFFYVNQQGVMRNTLTFDNGADYFSEGLTRTRIKGKVGYFDESLKIVIPARYDFGFPFTDGQAVVCNGCVEHSDSEHKSMVGGLWAVINKKGQLLQKMHPQSQ